MFSFLKQYTRIEASGHSDLLTSNQNMRSGRPQTTKLQLITTQNGFEKTKTKPVAVFLGGGGELQILRRGRLHTL